MDIYRLL